MIVSTRVENAQILECLLLQRNQDAGNHLLVGHGVGLQTVGHHIIYILDKHHIGIYLIQIFYQRSMTAWTEEQRAILIVEGSVVGISGDGIGTWLLLRERDVVLHTEFLGVALYLICHHLFEELQMVVRNGKVDICLTVTAGIKRSLYQVLLHRGANLFVGILMKLQQALRQLSVVESAFLQQICHHSLVLACLDQVAYAAALVLLALVAERLTEGKLLDIVEEMLLEVGSRHIIRRIKKRKEILEHSACRTRSRHKLHNAVALLLVLVPHLFILLYLLCVGRHDALANGCGTFETKEGKTIFDLLQLLFNLLLRNTASSNLG